MNAKNSTHCRMAKSINNDTLDALIMPGKDCVFIHLKQFINVSKIKLPEPDYTNMHVCAHSLETIIIIYQEFVIFALVVGLRAKWRIGNSNCPHFC